MNILAILYWLIGNVEPPRFTVLLDYASLGPVEPKSIDTEIVLTLRYYKELI